MATGLVGHVVVIWMVATALQAAETKAAAAAWLGSTLSSFPRKAGRQEGRKLKAMTVADKAKNDLSLLFPDIPPPCFSSLPLCNG